MRDGMEAVVYRGPGRVDVERVPVPPLEPGDLLVLVRAAALCGTDLKVIAHGHWKIPPGTPRILGHEFAGEIVGGALGESLPAGRVGVVPNLGCGVCVECRQGLDNLCPRYDSLGITLDGGLAEYVRIPAAAVRRGHVIPLPEDVGFEEAALIEPMSCVLNAHEVTFTGEGDRVLILGGGPMGLMHVSMARLRGAALIVVADPWPERRARAEAFGADAAAAPAQLLEAVHRFTEDQGFDVVVVTAPRPEAQEQAVVAAAPRGRVNLFAGLPTGARAPLIDVNAIHYRQVMLTGTTGSTVRHYRETLALVASGRLPLSPLVSGRVPLSSVHRILAEVREKRHLKVVLHPTGTAGADGEPGRDGQVREEMRRG